MFGHRSFLVIGGEDADIGSLIENGYECVHSEFSFEQGIDDNGKVQTGVLGGMIHINLSLFADEELITWGIKSKEYRDGMIVVVDPDNNPLHKIIFKRAACIGFQIAYKQRGNAYTSVMMTIQAREITVGSEVKFKNRWTDDD